LIAPLKALNSASRISVFAAVEAFSSMRISVAISGDFGNLW